MAQRVVGFDWSCHSDCCEQGVWCCQQSRGGSGLGELCHLALIVWHINKHLPICKQTCCSAKPRTVMHLMNTCPPSKLVCIGLQVHSYKQSSKVGDFTHNHTYRLLQHMHLLQMMQQAMKAAMKNMGGQPGQPGASPFGAGGMPGGMPAGFPGMPPNMQGGMGQGWPPAVDTTARPAGQHNLNLCLQALLVVRHMHNANADAIHACLHLSPAVFPAQTTSTVYATLQRQPIGCKRCPVASLALHIQPGRLVLEAIADATRHACLSMPDAEGLAFNGIPPEYAGMKCNLLSLHMPAGNLTAHLINHSTPYLLKSIQVLHHKVSQLPAHSNPPSIRMSTKASGSKSTRPSKPRGRLLQTPHPGAHPPHHLQPPLAPPAPLPTPLSSPPPSLMWCASLNSFTTLLPKVAHASFMQS